MSATIQSEGNPPAKPCSRAFISYEHVTSFVLPVGVGWWFMAKNCADDFDIRAQTYCADETIEAPF
ncbi:hypothetical protein DSM25558_3913 [Agrobacterium sp. DSM 25558]|nr:hypothetical protein DSM25558_3913 [Agrobacterium sp. DSM 25558]